MGSNDNLLYLSIGFLMGAALDYAWFAYNMPLSADVKTRDPQLTSGDIVQLIGSFGLTTIGFMSSSKTLAPFGFGMTAGGLFTKIVSPVTGLPRYIIADTPGGSAVLTPVGTNVRGAAQRKTGQSRQAIDQYYDEEADLIAAGDLY